ncbi:MAG: hypothetical protein Q7S74_03710 [Nanoarchaeota archaeon]|nr:hypothetical protein [Nanoarchaeota archaeon]
MELKQALQELRKEEKKKFDQSIDFILNLKGIDMKRDTLNAIITLPHKFKDKNVCAFLTKKSSLVNTITQPEFAKYKDKAALRKLVKNYDFFIAAAPLMPQVASTFGKVLGPAGKMPSPQMGVIMTDNEDVIKETLEKISNSIKIRMKEASIKIVVGKESMKDEDIIENVMSAYSVLLNALPKKVDNVKSVMIKLTMSKAIKVELK